MTDPFQAKLEAEVEKYKENQRAYQKTLQSRQQLDAQLTENTVVKEELSLMKSDSNVFKLIGPVLIKQDQEEARQNVDKRIDYIQAEM